MSNLSPEEVFGSLENYLIYLEEEKQRMKNILNLEFEWDDKDFYAYRVEELNEKIEGVKKEICAKKNL
ncbi:MAG: hypothetical protein E6704_07025 [Anaerococcus prevotii]|nr:hypothetical protein [Anaerococcus prevotii]